MVSRSVKFVLDKHDGETGAFFNTDDRLESELRVSVAHSGCGLLWDLDALRDDIRESVAKFLVGGQHLPSVLVHLDGRRSGFRDSATDDFPQSCSTYYAVRTLRRLGQREWIEDHRSLVERFLVSCYREEGGIGAFAPRPGATRSLAHTCLALVTLLDLLRRKTEVPRLPDEVHADAVLAFMRLCESTHGGFGFGRGPQVPGLQLILRPFGFRGRWYSPNVYMTRVVLCALDPLKSIDQSFSRLAENTEGLRGVVDRARFERPGVVGWAGYPRELARFAPREPQVERAPSAWQRLATTLGSVVLYPLFFPRPEHSLGPQEFTPVPYAALFVACAVALSMVACGLVTRSAHGQSVANSLPALVLSAVLAALSLASAAEVVLWRCRH